MSSIRAPSYPLSAPRTPRPTLSTRLLRSYYDYSYGYREPRAFTLPDCTCHYLVYGEGWARMEELWEATYMVLLRHN